MRLKMIRSFGIGSLFSFSTNLLVEYVNLFACYAFRRWVRESGQIFTYFAYFSLISAFLKRFIFSLCCLSQSRPNCLFLFLWFYNDYLCMLLMCACTFDNCDRNLFSANFHPDMITKYIYGDEMKEAHVWLFFFFSSDAPSNILNNQHKILQEVVHMM